MLEDQLKPLVQAELSILVDILYRPEDLFVPSSYGHSQCSKGGFMSKLVMYILICTKCFPCI
jgi:inositol 1,4,5-triphosphate receptor type 1